MLLKILPYVDSNKDPLQQNLSRDSEEMNLLALLKIDSSGFVKN